MARNISSYNKWNLNDCNRIRTYSHLVRKETLHNLAKLASLAKWLSILLWTKGLWVWIPLQSLTFRYWACFEQGVPWYSGNYRVYIHSKTVMWRVRTHSRNKCRLMKHNSELRFTGELENLIIKSLTASIKQATHQTWINKRLYNTMLQHHMHQG